MLRTAFLALALGGCADSAEKVEREAHAYLAKGDLISALIQFRSLLALQPGHVDAQLHAGRLLAETGQLKEGEGALRRALELGKPLEEVAPALVRLLLEMERYKEVLDLLEPDAKRGQPPADPKVLAEYSLLRARAYLGLGDLTAANTQFQLATSALPARAKLGLARVAMERNDRARAEELIGEVLASDPRAADAHLALGELRRSSGKLDEALLHSAEAVKVQPDSVDALLAHGLALATAGRTEEARRFVEGARKRAPAKPLAHFAQAMIDCRERLHAPCSEALQAVFDVMPDYMPAVLLAGQVNYSAGNFELAQAAFLRYLERSPNNIHARKMLAATLLARGQPAAALTVLRAMIAANTANAEMHGIAGQALLQLGHLAQARVALSRAAKLAPENAEFHTALAMAHLASGMYQRAEADFRTAIALSPPDTRADYGLVMMLVARHRTEQAQEAATAAERRLPKKPEAHMLKGVVARSAEDWRGARQSFQRANELDPQFFPAIQELVDLDLRDGNPDTARKRVQEVLRRNRTHLDALLAIARIEIAAGRQQDALTWARQAAEAHPRSTHAMLMVAETQMEAGKTAEAMVSARQALNLQPRDARALRVLGQMQMIAKDYVGASTTFNSLVRAQPGSVEAHTLLASALLASGDVTTALSVARKSIKPDPRNAEARALLADVLIQGGKLGDALEFARQAQRDSPKSAFGFRLEAEALLAQGDARRAAKAFEAAVKLEPSGFLLTRMHQAQSMATPGAAPDAQLEEWVRKNPEDMRTRMYLATVLSASGRKKEAIVHYKEVVRRDGKNARALNNLAWALHAVGDTQAVTYAEQAYQLDPSEAAVADTFGWILVGNGRLHEGIQMLLKAVALDGKNPEIRYHLGKALAQAGDKSRARTELKTALNTGKPFPQVEEARALLVSLGP